MSAAEIRLWAAILAAERESTAAGLSGRVYPRKVARLTRRPLREVLRTLNTAVDRFQLHRTGVGQIAFMVTDRGYRRAGVA